MARLIANARSSGSFFGTLLGMDVFKKILNPSDDMSVCSLVICLQNGTKWFVAPGYVSSLSIGDGSICPRTHTLQINWRLPLFAHILYYLSFPPSSHHRHIFRRSHAPSDVNHMYGFTLTHMIATSRNISRQCDVQLMWYDLGLIRNLIAINDMHKRIPVIKFVSKQVLLIENIYVGVALSWLNCWRRDQIGKSNWALCCIN